MSHGTHSNVGNLVFCPGLFRHDGAGCGIGIGKVFWGTVAFWKICRFVNDELQTLGKKRGQLWGLPVERPHGEVVILPLSDSQLFLKILKGIEGVAGIEFFIVLSMTALHFPVVSRECRG